MLWNIIWITALAGMGGTGLGGLVSCLFRKDSSKTVSLLLSFAAGVMTSVVCFDLLTEALHQIGEKSVFLWAFKENHRARRFYEKHGFHWDGTERVSEFDRAVEVRYVKA